MQIKPQIHGKNPLLKKVLFDKSSNWYLIVQVREQQRNFSRACNWNLWISVEERQIGKYSLFEQIYGHRSCYSKINIVDYWWKKNGLTVMQLYVGDLTYTNLWNKINYTVLCILIILNGFNRWKNINPTWICGSKVTVLWEK